MSKTAYIREFWKNMKGFDRYMDTVKILAASNGNITATFQVTENHLNPIGNLHGGLATALVDSISSTGLITHEKAQLPSMSVNLDMTFLKAATAGDELLIESKAINVGRNVAFIKIDVTNKVTGDLIMQGSHTKYIMKKKIR